MPFTGFTSNTLYTPVPNPLFGPVLEQIEDLAELKVTLRGLWLLHRKKVSPRTVALAEFLGDRSLLRGLSAAGRDPAEEVRRGLKLAVHRGTFLAHGEDGPGQLFLLNAEADRRALARIERSGEPDSANARPNTIDSGPAVPERPNIFVLYEDNIGTLSPILADQLKEAEERYPWNWIREAFEIAVVQNKRNWRYIVGILRRWGAEGKEAGKDDGKDEGKDNGKPGRHTPKDQRQKYLEEYERRRGRYSGNRSGR